MTVLIVLAIVLSLLMSFFYSGSETAVISANQYRLRHAYEHGDETAGSNLAMLSRMPRLLSAVLIGTNLANVLAVLFFKSLLNTVWAESHSRAVGFVNWDEIIAIVLLTPVIVIFAEILPKALFRARADRWLNGLRPALNFSIALFAPAIYLLEAIVRLFMLPFDKEPGEGAKRLTRSDLVMILNAPGSEMPEETEAEEKRAEAAAPADSAAKPAFDPIEIFEPDERRLVQNILELDQTQAGEIMKPLVDLETVHLRKTAIDEFLEKAAKSGHTRFPAYHDRIVNLVGYIDVYDIIRDHNRRSKLEDYLRPAHYVPETKRVDDLLQEFLQLRLKLAIVVDEFGGCVGIVTREDIIEEIVGEFEDELDQRQITIAEQPDGSYLIDGRLEVEDVNEVLGTEYDDEDCVTLGGLIMKEMGRVPKTGDAITLQGWRLEVTEMDGRRPATIHARKRRS